MDWKKTFTKGSWIFHGIFLVAILATLGTGIFALRLSHYQSTEQDRTIKIKELINFMKSDDTFEKIAKCEERADLQRSERTFQA